MMALRNKVLVVGASGLVGQAAVRAFESDFAWDVVCVSRRPPRVGNGRARHIAVDLLDAARCVDVFGAMHDVTHVVYAAVNEDSANLIRGWLDLERMQLNQRMLENAFEPLLRVAPLRQVSLLQGTKAYGGVAGVDVGHTYRERAPRAQHDNFYWLQEDYLRRRQQGQAWCWTILRPVLVLGDAVGSNLNSLLVIAVYAALRREAGLPLAFPGSARRQTIELVDSDLVAAALKWATAAPGAVNATFNLGNGDVVALLDLYPVIAEEMGMAMGPPEPLSFRTWLPAQADAWRAIVREYRLKAPEDLLAMLGGSGELAVSTPEARDDGRAIAGMGHSSTIAIRKAGFHDCIDSEDSVRKWIRRYQELRLIPPRV
jgi:nucleoside-diphosphate-sugar epimerase